MNNITTEEILERLNKRIDYNEIARILEHDLNLIASEVATNFGDDTPVAFQVFFDFAEFDTYINNQAPGEGQGYNDVPVVISLVNGDYSTEKGPELYSTTFRIEAFGFEAQKDRLRAIFETFSSLNQGTTLSGMFNSSMTTSFTDFPIMTTPEPYKGEDRMSVFMTWNINFIYTGQLANEVEFELDGQKVTIQGFNIKRDRSFKAVQRNGSAETTANVHNQTLILTGTVIYDGSDATKRLLRSAKKLYTDMTEEFNLKITWPSILDENEEPEVDEYKLVLVEGDITVVEGSYVDMSVS